MTKKTKIALSVLIALVLCALAAFVIFVPYIQGSTVPVLEPKGIIGQKQKDLLIQATWLMLIIVIPVMALTFFVGWKYRSTNKNAKYEPEWDNSHLAESIWWGFPCAIIIVLSIMTWLSSHQLDPRKPLVSDVKPITIQVIALQWKWLFIYPEQGIATVNYIRFPEKTPINFEITAEAPMNSFWIPQLGGQIYAMPGMRTRLHLISDVPGSYRGVSANLSGTGFAGMKFIAQATTQEEFDEWVTSVKQGNDSFDLNSFNQLAQPTENNPVVTYSSVQDGLFDQIVMRYMPMPDHHQVDAINKAE